MSVQITPAAGSCALKIDNTTRLTVSGAAGDASVITGATGKFGSLRHPRGPYSTVLQCVPTLVNTIASYSAPAYSSTLTTVSALNVSITPTNVNSRLVVLWQISGEGGYNILWRVNRDGVEQSDGRNTMIGTSSANYLAYSVGYVVQPYDYAGDVASTLNNFPILYSCIAGTTQSTTFSLTVGSSDSGAPAFSLNKVSGGAAIGQDAYEIAVSHVTIWEISQ